MGSITRKPSSITIFLADGLPDGLRVVEKSGWTGQAVVCPRSRFPEAKADLEFARTGVYVLCGPSDGDLPTVYVGEGDPTRPRLEQHFVKKEFWTSLIVFTSKDENLNKAHVQYLESRLVSLARNAKRCILDNSNDPQLPTLGVVDRAAMEAFLEEMLLIYPLVGLTAFEVPSHRTGGTPDTTLYAKKAKEIIARGYDKVEGFVVLAGSIANKENLPAATPALQALRERLVKQGILVAEGDHLKFTQDYTFNSSSQAAAVLVGGNAAGPTYWKDDQGRTLKAIQEAGLTSSLVAKTVDPAAQTDGGGEGATAGKGTIPSSQTTGTLRTPTGTIKLTQKRMLTFMASRPEGRTFSRHDLLCVGTGKPLGTNDRVTTLDGSHIGNIRDENTHPYSLLARGWVETVEIEKDGHTSTRLQLTPEGRTAAKEHQVELSIEYPDD